MTTCHEERYSNRGYIHTHDKAVDEALDICFKSTTHNCKPANTVTICLGLLKQIMSVSFKVTYI